MKKIQANPKAMEDLNKRPELVQLMQKNPKLLQKMMLKRLVNLEHLLV